MRVNFFRIDLHGTLKSFTCGIQFSALLMNQPEIVVRRSIRGIKRRGLEVLFERRARALLASQFADITSQQEEKHEE